jgi:hypothetical protein
LLAGLWWTSIKNRMRGSDWSCQEATSIEQID